MKVFISWSGEHSKRLGEALRDWIPGVLQLVRPYFTPADIDKGARWSTEISKELSESKIGILCVTPHNIHSDWILFEAGALSKSLDRSRVCPILFGITSTDLAGPLKQFQTTVFDKTDIHQLLNTINNETGERKLPAKTLDSVFEKWWPELETTISQILDETGEPEEPIRSDRDLLEEILQLSRRMTSQPAMRRKLPPAVFGELLRNYITLHDSQVAQQGGYQTTLDLLKKMHRSVDYLTRRYAPLDKQLQNWLNRFDDLSYSVLVENGEDGDLSFVDL